jgi:hypothetical protein
LSRIFASPTDYDPVKVAKTVTEVQAGYLAQVSPNAFARWEARQQELQRRRDAALGNSGHTGFALGALIPSAFVGGTRDPADGGSRP